MHLQDIQAGVGLRGPIFPEEVKILAVKPLGPNRVKLEAVGVNTRKYYDPVLTLEELAGLERADISVYDFSGDPERAFLCLEGLRIRNAFQFDPLYGVNISRVDPLPHQIEAVYHYILKNPSLRFLLADDPGAGKTIMAGHSSFPTALRPHYKLPPSGG